MEAVLDVKISWKFEASTMKKRGENEKWKIVEMKSEDLKYLRHFLTDLAEIFRVVLKCQYLDVKWAFKKNYVIFQIFDPLYLQNGKR